ncbi:MAG: mitochondrial fission ELM1 family protein [Alphaproteobacteria bacterium]
MEPSAVPQQAAISAPGVWVLTDPVIGHASQSLGVAEALGWPFAVKAMAYGRFARVPCLLGPRWLCGLDAASRASLAPPWPDIVIATGRRLGGVARWIKRRAAQDRHRTFLVQMMDPQYGRRDFDLIAAPRHDRLVPRENVVTTLGAPTRVTPERLAAEADRWRDRLAALPRPRVALLVGGSTGKRRFTPEMAAELGRRASVLARGGSVMATTSRRTDAAAADALVAAIAAPSHIHRWAPDGENPYYALLGLADAVVVTGESVSMASEAAAAGKPLFIYAPPALTKPAFARFHGALYAEGMARPLSDDAALGDFAGAPLDAARDIAGEIRRRWR